MMGSGTGAPTVAAAQPAKARKDDPDAPQALMNAEIAARVDRVLAAPIGFGERLVMFWANHFAVQAASDEAVRGLAGASSARRSAPMCSAASPT